jgi:hypothetical protein
VRSNTKDIIKREISSLESLLIGISDIEILKLDTKIVKENKIDKSKYILVLGLNLLLPGSLGVL